MFRWQCRLLFTIVASLSPLTLDAAETRVGKYSFRIADGFSVELVAAPPLVKYPICADYDYQGRLYVCESSGSVDWNKPQTPESMHKVLRLSDTDGDGVYDKRTVFAEFEMMAQGSMWLDGSLYVAAAPIIWKLTDTDDDGIADKREEWVKTDKTTNCLNDLRGPYRGPDGYIYWSKGPALQEYLVDGKPWASSARHIMRRHPDSENAEPLMVGGMDNPIEIAFTPGGQRMITCTYIQAPGAPRDDGILHAIYGGVYPKDIAPIYEFPWTGPDVLTPLTTFGAISPAGLMCYESRFMGDEFRGNLFSAHFNGHRIVRTQLKPNGSAYGAINGELFGCDNVEFHPTEVMEDADGSLIVIETGGWYRNCCPSSTFYRPDVDGAIYRIRHRDAKPVIDPLGNRISWTSLDKSQAIELLSDSRPVVRRRAIETLAKLGLDSLPALAAVIDRPKENEETKLAAIWTAVRIDDKQSLAVLQRGLRQPEEHVRQAALSAISLKRDPFAFDLLVPMLESASLHEQRLAAEAIGRLRNAKAIPHLLAALKRPCDRSLDHQLIYALIEIGDAEAIEPGLTSENANVRRASMIAIDQIAGSKLEPRIVLAELEAADQRLRDAAWWLVSRHPQEWGGLMKDDLRKLLASADTEDKQLQLRHRLARLSRSPELAQWMAQELTASGVSASSQMLLLGAMSEAGGQFVDPSWVESLKELLQQSRRESNLVEEIVATLAKLPPLASSGQNKELTAELDQDLIEAAKDSALDPSTRLRAFTSVRGKLPELDEASFKFVVTQLEPERALDIRTAAAETLSRSKLTDNQKTSLARGLKNLASTELTTLLGIFQEESDDKIGFSLVNSLLGSSSADTLNALRLKSLLSSFSPEVQASAQPLLARLERAQADQLLKAENVMKLVSTADPKRGLQVFSSAKAACLACHKAHNVGAVTGPALKGIGARRNERDLLESILFPSASIVQSYDTWKVLTNDGQALSGVLVEDRPEEIVLSAGQEKNYRIPRSSIEEMTRSEVSIMPAGLDKLMSDQELADLIAFLKSL